MATAWQNRFTPLSQVNNGNELENGDTATGEHITIALENGAYAKGKADQNESDITALGNRTTSLEGRTTSLEGDMSTAQGNISSIDGRVTTLESRQNIVRHTGSVTYNASTFSLYNLIFSHPFIKFKYIRSSSISRDEYPVFVSISANYTATPTSYSTSAYYMSGGSLTSVPSGATLEYEYFTVS